MRCPRLAMALATALAMALTTALAMVILRERGLCPNRGDWGWGLGARAILKTPPCGRVL